MLKLQTYCSGSNLIYFKNLFMNLSRRTLSSESVQDKHGYVRSKEEFKYAEKLISCQIVPDPPKHDVYPTPSGWRPPDVEKSSKFSYFALRSRYHSYPIYYEEREGGSRKLVRIKNIEGDIWEFDKDLRNFIKNCLKTEENKDLNIYSQVNEVQRHILVKGEFQHYIKRFFEHCGF